MIPALRDRRPSLCAGAVMCLALSAGAADACRCADLSREALFDSADMVFVGRITSTDRTGDLEIALEAEVEDRFKGTPGDRVRFLTTGTCAYEAAPGERHLFYLHDDAETGPRTGICDGNMGAAEAADILRDLAPLAE